MRVAVTFVACALIWGSTFLAIRFGNEAVPPLWAATIRLAIASILLFAITRMIGTPLPRGRALRGAAPLGVVRPRREPVAAVRQRADRPERDLSGPVRDGPLSTALLAAAFRVERLVTRKLVAAAIAIGGVAVIFAGELGVAVPFTGLLTIFGAATAAALGNVLLKREPSPPVFALNAIGTAIAAAVCLVASFLVGESHAIPTTAAAWIPILYLTLAGSLGAFVLFSWLVTHWTVSNASLVGVTVPIIAVILGGVVKGEQPAPLTYLGAVVVIGAIFIAIRAPHHEPVHASAATATD